MTNKCGNGNYLGQPAWGPAPEPIPWHSYLWIIVCSYWMLGVSLPLRFTKQQKRQLRNHTLIAFGVIVAFILWVIIMAYGQPAIRGY